MFSMTSATKSRPLLRMFVLWVGGALLFQAQLSAQTNSGQPQSPAAAAGPVDLTLKSVVRRVIVDVVVTDSDGKTVRDLKADDFSVTEDGHVERIASFDPYGS